MEQIASLRSCLDNDGNFDPAKFAQYRNQRCQYFDKDEEEEVVVLKKRKFAHRHYEGYDPQSALMFSVVQQLRETSCKTENCDVSHSIQKKISDAL